MSDTYPDAPGFKAPGPSEDAANAIAPIAGTLRDQVREVIASSPSGITADNIARKLNRSILSIRPRVAELHRLGEVRQSGARGKNESGMTAALWVMAPPLQPACPGSDRSEPQT
jgi:hypothetical protein